MSYTGYDDWVISFLPALPTDTALQVYYTSKQGPYTTQAGALAAQAAIDSFTGASGELAPTSLTAPGRKCSGQYLQTGGWYAWWKPTTQKRLDYIAAFWP